MRVERFDHVVLTVADIGKTITFYSEVLGMKEVTFGDGRKALAFGESKLNLHQASREIDPKARRPTAGSADVCLIVEDRIDDVIIQLADAGVAVEEGPVQRTGALGPIVSCYLRDPDGNLIELSNYDTAAV